MDRNRPPGCLHPPYSARMSGAIHERGRRPPPEAVVGHGFPRRALLTSAIAANLILVSITIAGFFVSDVGYDWLIYAEAGRRVFDGTLYAWNDIYAWSYSPLLAYFFSVIAPVGYLGWTVAHVGAVMALRQRWLIVGTLLSWPFWADVYNGNTMTFVFVAGALALAGSAAATAAYLGLFLLMPRPVMAPLLLWILWRRPGWRWKFLALSGVNALLVILTGYGPAWLSALTSVSDAVAATTRDIGPANFLGGAWVLVGLVLAAVFILRARVGLASIAASPYWLPQYLIMLLLEFVPKHQPQGSRTPPGDQTP